MSGGGDSGVNRKFDNIQHRSSLRGLKRCNTCKEYNGQRAVICRNVSCESRKLALRPIKIVNLTDATTTLYSLRSRERDARLRSFVRIQRQQQQPQHTNTGEDVYYYNRDEVGFGSIGDFGGGVGSGGGSICYAEACKTKNGSCKHIEECHTNEATQADVYTVSCGVLWHLNIEEERKQRLWHVCKANEHGMPAVQRLNESTFVVQSAITMQAATSLNDCHMLHVTVHSDAANAKKGTYHCACSNNSLKIILQPDTEHSVVMQEEVCDHILLVLAAVLSRQEGKLAYSNFTNALKSYWMPVEEMPGMRVHNDLVPDTFFGLSVNNIADEYACDNILDIPSSPTGFAQSITQLFGIDLKSDSFEPIATAAPPAITTITTLDGDDIFGDTRLELSDCNIELMDQFEATDHIDLPSDDILNLSITYDQLQAMAQSAVMEPVKPETKLDVIDPTSLLQCEKATSVVNATPTTHALPTIELPTIEVVKKCPVKTKALVNEVKTRKFPHIPAKRALVVNTNDASAVTTTNTTTTTTTVIPVSELDEPKLAYSAWFEYVIESINQSVQITEQTDIIHQFHVHEEIFAHFSKTFSNGNNLRMPNSTVTIEHGQHKGLTKYIWYFTASATVQRIFTTNNISIQLSRYFEHHNDVYVPYTQPKFVIETQSKKPKRRIYSKIQLHTAQIRFANSNLIEKQTAGGVLVEWLPHVFPRSHFGRLTIRFALDIQHPSLTVR